MQGNFYSKEIHLDTKPESVLKNRGRETRAELTGVIEFRVEIIFVVLEMKKMRFRSVWP